VNPDAPCRCVKKTRAFIQGGFVDPRKLQFTSDYQRQWRDVADDRAGELMEPYMKVAGQVYGTTVLRAGRAGRHVTPELCRRSRWNRRVIFGRAVVTGGWGVVLYGGG